MIESKYIYSRLAPSTVTELIILHYEVQNITSCVYYVFGLHDNYLIETQNKKYIVRIYRNDWRSQEEIHFELELLNYLRENKQSVAYPIPTKDRELSFEIDSPEGKRHVALFSYANGEALNREITDKESELLGITVANVHKASDNFRTEYKRKNIDLEHLIDQSLVLIKPYINTQEYSYLKSVKDVLDSHFSNIKIDAFDYGICTGDVNHRNFHINRNSELTLFDFDQCGYSYRAFELGKYLSSVNSITSKKKNIKAFLKGYESIKKLTKEEHEAIPYFEIASVIWVMSIRAANKNKVGQMLLEKPYWDQRIGIVKNLVEQLEVG